MIRAQTIGRFLSQSGYHGAVVRSRFGEPYVYRDGYKATQAQAHFGGMVEVEYLQQGDSPVALDSIRRLLESASYSVKPNGDKLEVRHK